MIDSMNGKSVRAWLHEVVFYFAVVGGTFFLNRVTTAIDKATDSINILNIQVGSLITSKDNNDVRLENHATSIRELRQDVKALYGMCSK